MEPLPEYAPDGAEELSYFNSWRGDMPQTVTKGDNFALFASINPLRNLLFLDVTGQEFDEMLSALYVGAEFAYPEKYLEIVFNFLSAVQAPPDLIQECIIVPTYAANVDYPLQNPYTEPDEIPEGYLAPPMVLVTEENADDFPNYQPFDVAVPFNAFPIDTNWFEELDGKMPTATLVAVGEGTVEIKLLTTPLGGLAIITVDDPPNLVDILAGIITGADNIVDLNKDIVSLPPETADEIIYEVELTGDTEHTVYVVFFPIIDDSVTPVRFGGGLRGFEMCGFHEEPTMGVMDIRYDAATDMLQKNIGGEWLDVVDWEGYRDGVVDAIDTVANQAATALSLAGDAQTDAANAQDTANAAAAAAAAAQASANGAISVNNTQNTRLTNLENRMTTAELDIDIAQADILNLFSIVGSSASQEAWAFEWDLLASANGWTSPTASWVSGEGFVMNGSARIQYLGVTLFDNRVTHARFDVRRENGGFGTMSVEYANSDGFGVFRMSGAGLLTNQWFKVPNNDAQPTNLDFLFSNFDGNVRLQKIKVLGRGLNLFDL